MVRMEKPLKSTIKQTKGDNWAISSLHAETVSGRVVIKKNKTKSY
jgi:hypothetical protein